MPFNICFEGVSGKRGIFLNGKLAIEVFFLSRPAIDFSYWWERVDDNLILGSYTFSMPSTITEGLARQENIMGVVTMQPGTDAEQQESPVEGFSLASVMKIMTLAAPQAWSQPLLPGPPINMEFCNLPPPERDADKDKEIYAKFEQFLKKIKASGGCVYVQLTSECITLMGTYLTTTSNCSPQAAVKRMLKIQPEFKKEAKKCFFSHSPFQGEVRENSRL